MSKLRKLNIQPEWCKGCGICIAFCPRNALSLINKKAMLTNESACILCGLCEQRCPDYAIYISSEPETANQHEMKKLSVEGDMDCENRNINAR